MDQAMQQRARNTVEVGAFVAAFVFIITMVFNAGIQYANISDLQDSDAKQDVRLQVIEGQRSTDAERFARIEVMLQQLLQRQAGSVK